MAFGNTASEWLLHNRERNYPLTAWSTRVTADNSYTLPTEVLLASNVAFNWDEYTHIGTFHIRRIQIQPNVLRFVLAARIASLIVDVATATVALPLTEATTTLEWVWLPPMPSLVGELTLGDAPQLPPGDYEFDPDGLALEMDTIRPIADKFNAIIVAGNALRGRFQLVSGDGSAARLERREDGDHVFVDSTLGDAISQDCECIDAVTEPVYTLNGVPGEHFEILEDLCFELIPGNAAIRVNNTCYDTGCGCVEAAALRNYLPKFSTAINNLTGQSETLYRRLDQIVNLPPNVHKPRQVSQRPDICED